MKREHQEGQLRIRRLQRENVDMHREVQQCSEMLQNANHYYKSILDSGFLEITQFEPHLNSHIFNYCRITEQYYWFSGRRSE